MSRRLADASYRRLTPTERYRLAMEAFDRADADELRRLSNTCPEGSYWGQDPRYTERIRASRVVALMASNFIWRAAAMLQPVLRADVRGDVLWSPETDAFETVEQAPCPDEAASIKPIDAECAKAGFGFRVGIARFCDELGVEPRKLLRLEPSCLPVWELLSNLAEDRVYDAGVAEGVYQTLTAEWASFVDDGEVVGEGSPPAA